ncbi:MAG: hypothetical protein ACRDUX_11880, partial [Mycobacterium sp.]
TKLTAVNSGDLFWRNVSDVPIDQAELSPEARAMVEQAMFVEPLPFVRRVVFIATPQRGSYLAGPDLVRRLARRLITLPAALVTSSADLLRSSAARQARIKNPPTSIDNMSPGHPFILTIATIPVSPEVAANSIVGVTGGEPLESGGDGVVKYSSAHVDGVESELIVNSEHSMQSKPEVISEVQRILHRHLELNQCVAGAVSAASGVTGDAAEPR